MNKTKYMQTDKRWGGLGYPEKPWYLRNCGCGEVSICNAIIEMEQYKKYTPATIQPYCKRFADPHGNGTYWSGIPAMMKHYGMTEVKEHATMAPLWKELAKGGRIAIYLMGSRKGGSKGVHWTSSGHFVCSVAYKYEKGKHWVYVKDSYSNSSLRNGWISYEDNMKYDVLKVWSGKLNSNAPTTSKPAPTAPNKNEKKAYGGTYPTTKLVKSNAQVIADTILWARWIASDNSFHYGYTNKHGSKDPRKWDPNAHHNGCFFCNTNTTKGGRSKKGIVDYKKTYCCNPFVGAAWAHGGCVPKALELCRKGSSWDFHKGKGYDSSSLFKNLGHPKKSALEPGDVLCRDTHVALYIGGGKIVHAAGGDDNKRNSKKWNNSIRVQTLTDANYKRFKRVHRFTGKVNADCPIRHGEVSVRVKHMQEYLNWYFDGKVGTPDGIYGDNTLKWVKAFQEAEIGKGSGDGIVGPKTIEAMKKVRR